MTGSAVKKPFKAKRDADTVSEFSPDWSFPVVEKFVSVNGEGLASGQLAAFIRFAGCNLDCTYCDTRWANVPAAREQAEMHSVASLVDWVRSTGVSLVTLTGGEPLLQVGLPDLIAALLDVVDPYPLRVEIETNGSCDITALVQLREERNQGCCKACADDYDAAFLRDDMPVCSNAFSYDGESVYYEASACSEASVDSGEPVDSEASGSLHFTIDWKTPAAGEAVCAAMMRRNFEILDDRDAVKFVVGSIGDLEFAAHCADEANLWERCQVFFSPIWGQIEPHEIVDFMVQKRLDRARLQLQMHKIIWPNVDKGV